MCIPRDDCAPSTLLYTKSEEGSLNILGLVDSIVALDLTLNRYKCTSMGCHG